MIYFDGHVHIQDLFSLDVFFTKSIENFSKQITQPQLNSGAIFFLLLTESKTHDYFSLLRKEATKRTGILSQSWKVKATMEAESLLLCHEKWPDVWLFVVAGRQIVTAERLEVLALGTTTKFDDGVPLEQTIELVQQKKGLAVLPWGVGKWLGKRGRIVKKIIENTQSEKLFVGDNGGRPVFWPAPAIFTLAAKRGIRLLPGSDPLPLAEEEHRAGSYGGSVPGECTAETPFTDLKTILADQNVQITPFGNKQGAIRFFKTQIALRMP